MNVVVTEAGDFPQPANPWKGLEDCFTFLLTIHVRVYRG